MKNLTFSEALEALKDGKRIAREGWNGKNMYVYKSGGGTFSMETADMNPKVKEDLIKRGLKEVTFLDHVNMVSATTDIVVGWLASQTDMLSNDWQILED